MIHLSLSVPTASTIWEAFINYSELQKAHFMPALISFSINDLLKKKMTKTLTHIGSGAGMWRHKSSAGTEEETRARKVPIEEFRSCPAGIAQYRINLFLEAVTQALELIFPPPLQQQL